MGEEEVTVRGNSAVVILQVIINIENRKVKKGCISLNGPNR